MVSFDKHYPLVTKYSHILKISFYFYFLFDLQGLRYFKKYGSVILNFPFEVFYGEFKNICTSSILINYIKTCSIL